MNMVTTTRRLSRAVVVGFASGVLIEVPTVVAAIISGGAGHGDYAAARALFPFAMLLTLFEGRIGPFSMTVGLLQFPMYGALLGWSLDRRNYLPVLVVAIAHIMAAMLCFSGILPEFS